MESEEKEWIKKLRADGIKASHPDDGWVDRDVNKVFLSYPQFNDGIQIGDRIALGWSWEYRIVRVTKIEESVLMRAPYYYFMEG